MAALLKRGVRPAPERAQKLFDLLTAFAGALLDLANQLVDIAIERLQIVVGHLPILLFDLAFDLVPVSLKSRLIDHESTPYQSFASVVSLYRITRTT
jgi:hypothetical protein